MRSLNLATFPLTESSLVEASAGTGKTFSIALLYLRAIAGIGCTPRTVEQVLVVTFTVAATEELKARIHRQLSEARAWFQGPVDVSDDSPLARVCRQVAPEQHALVCDRIGQALLNLDQAAIMTIHSWAIQAIRRHPLGGHTAVKSELVTSHWPLQVSLILDYWRSHFYGQGDEVGACVSAWFKTPEDLAKALRTPIAHAELSIEGDDGVTPVDDLLRQLVEGQARLAADLDQLRRRLAADAQAFFDGLRDHAPGANHQKLSMLGPKQLESSLTEWNEWLTQGGEPPPTLIKFANRGWVAKKNQAAWDHWAIDSLRLWCEASERFAIEDVAIAKARLLGHARQWVLSATAQALRSTPSISFNEVLTQLHATIIDADSGAASALAQQYPLALIDEFQDTDPLQWAIFKRIYDEHRPACLVLIGDPKQAIYSFRGADIYAYLDAKRSMGSRVYRMGVNYRSDPGVVAGCNALFSASAHPGGPFRVREADGVSIDYDPVSPNRTESGLGGVEGLAPVQWLFGQASNKNEHVREMAEIAAESIANLLQSGFMIEGKRLAARDVAVLVRKGSQASRVREALTSRGVASVYLSDKNSLFAQPEAVDVLAWLKLAADPSDDRRLRSAVITASLGLAWSDLDRLMGDGDAWERFREQALVWGAMAQAGGLQSMFMELWAYFGVRERLLDSQRGARTFANLMQLAEWCQRAWPEQGSVSSLIRALERLMLEPDNTDVQRMETDQDVVQIVTVHKSKGLEYPVVVAPFLCVADPVSDSAPAVVARTPAGRLLSVVGGKAAPEHWAAADEERLQEDLRLLYVAVTRAKHLLLACAGPLKSGLDKSAVGSLLGVGKGADLAETLSQLSSGGDLGLHHGPLALEPKPRSLPSGRPKAALTPSFRLPPRRWVASFTALTRRLEQGEETPYAAHWHDEQSPSAESAPSPPAADSDASSGVLTDFPRGPEAGTFLHSVIEWAHTAGFTRVASEHEWRLATLQTMAVARGYGDHTSQLDQWLVTMLNTEFVGFGAGPMCLSRQPPAIAEFEFLLGMGRLPVRRLDEFCQSRILPGRPRAALSAADLNGFMKGFIDWVVEHEGRYWLVDWKSNDLAGDYSGGAMEQAVLGHRYDVQMAIYLVALHRHLTSRLPHYDPGRHLGGAAYCFLRGTQSPSQGMHWCSGDMTWVAECSELLRPEVFQ